MSDIAIHFLVKQIIDDRIHSFVRREKRWVSWSLMTGAGVTATSVAIRLTIQWDIGADSTEMTDCQVK